MKLASQARWAECCSRLSHVCGHLRRTSTAGGSCVLASHDVLNAAGQCWKYQLHLWQCIHACVSMYIPKATSFVGLTHDLASTSVRCLCRFPDIAIVSDLIRVPFWVKINACWTENLSSSSLFQYLFADALRFSQTRFYCSLATVVAVDTFVHLSGSEYQLFKPRLVRIRIASCRGSIFPTFIYVATSIHICYLALHICRCMPIHVSNLVVVFLCCRVWCCVVVC